MTDLELRISLNQGGTSILEFVKAAVKATEAKAESEAAAAAAQPAAKEKPATAEAKVDSDATKSKLGASKLAGSKVMSDEADSKAGGVQKASMPSETTGNDK